LKVGMLSGMEAGQRIAKQAMQNSKSPKAATPSVNAVPDNTARLQSMRGNAQDGRQSMVVQLKKITHMLRRMEQDRGKVEDQRNIAKAEEKAMEAATEKRQAVKAREKAKEATKKKRQAVHELKALAQMIDLEGEVPSKSTTVQANREAAEAKKVRTKSAKTKVDARTTQLGGNSSLSKKQSQSDSRKSAFQHTVKEVKHKMRSMGGQMKDFKSILTLLMRKKLLQFNFFAQ